ncbi:MAG: hypothetical protein ACLFUJ_09060 [Phycisphaerae bacterium]
MKTVKSEAELKDVFNSLSQGGSPVNQGSYPGKMVQLPDGTRVGLRSTSKTGGSTIDIKHPDGSKQKVHIK